MTIPAVFRSCLSFYLVLSAGFLSPAVGTSFTISLVQLLLNKTLHLRPIAKIQHLAAIYMLDTAAQFILLIAQFFQPQAQHELVRAAPCAVFMVLDRHIRYATAY